MPPNAYPYNPNMPSNAYPYNPNIPFSQNSPCCSYTVEYPNKGIIKS